MKLILKITAAIVLSAFIICGIAIGAFVGIPMYAKSQAQSNIEHYMLKSGIDCDKYYDIPAARAVQLKHCGY